MAVSLLIDISKFNLMFLLFFFLVYTVECVIWQVLDHIFLFDLLLSLLIWEIFLFDRKRYFHHKE